MKDNLFDSFDEQAKKMMKMMIGVWVALAVVSIGSILGIIWFIFWCLQKFNVI